MSEQVVARALLQLSEVYGMATFCLYLADADPSDPSDPFDIEHAGPTLYSRATQEQAVLVKLCSKDYAAALHSSLEEGQRQRQGQEQSRAVELREAVKVCFRCGSVYELLGATAIAAHVGRGRGGRGGGGSGGGSGPEAVRLPLQLHELDQVSDDVVPARA